MRTVNNWRQKLAVGITETDTTITLNGGRSRLLQRVDPATFNMTTVTLADEPVILTLFNDAGQVEIIHAVDSGAGDQDIVIERAKEGTIARPWINGTLIEARITAGLIEHIKALATA